MDNWNQIEQQSNIETKRIRLEQSIYYREKKRELLINLGTHGIDYNKRDFYKGIRVLLHECFCILLD